MLYRMEQLIGMAIGAADGLVGKVKDVYFDDHRWAARYLVVDTGEWLTGRKVLISPISVEHIDWDSRTLRVGLTRAQVKDSPDIDTDKPVSRQHEVALLDYYDYPEYFSGGLLWGSRPWPMTLGESVTDADAISADQNHPDIHLRSLKEVVGYHLLASDDSIGQLRDFLLDDRSWAMQYVLADTGNWWLGKQVVFPPKWIDELDWQDHKVYVDVTREQVRTSPEYDPAALLTRDYETALYGHYRRPGYWF